MELICLFITLAIASSYFWLLSSHRPEGVLYKVLASSVLTSAQIILSELFLGLFHQLYLSSLIIVNMSIAAVVLVMGRQRMRNSGSKSLQNDVLMIKEAARVALDGPAIALGMLAALTYGWILAAAYFLPPRGLDDLTYHLSSVFEYVQSHEIRLLPLDVIWPFAFPENGELLYLWSIMFTHAQRWVDGMNVPFVMVSVLTIYALLRHFAVRERDAFFAALLYALCPVVLMVAGVNYVDIIVSLFLLLSLYFTLLYHKRGKILDLYLAGLSTGLMCGMKYTGVLLALPLQALIIPALGKGRWRHAIGYAAVVAFAGGWWYVRNAVALGDPLFPMKVLSSLPRAVRGTQGGSILQNVLYNAPYWMSRYPLSDAGVGRYDGGFGLVFWGMGFPSWVYVTLRSFFTIRSAKVSVFVVLAYLPLGFLLLLMMPPQWIDVNGRFSMFVVVIGLFALCEVFSLMQAEGFISIIKGVCVALSIVTVSLMFISDRPSYRLAGAVSDAVHHAEVSEFKYLADSLPAHAMLRPAWEVLDLLTRHDSPGMNCVIVATQDPDIFMPAPVYGSRLQNRVLNMSAVAVPSVDAYVCAYLGTDRLDRPVTVTIGRQQRTMTVQAIMTRDDYIAVVQTDHACLMLRKDIFNRPDKRKILQSYYRTTWPEAVAAAAEAERCMDDNIPVITASEIAYGIRSLDMGSGRSDRVYLSFDRREHDVAARLGLEECYTFGAPLAGYRSRKVSRVVFQGKGVDVYLNRRS